MANKIVLKKSSVSSKVPLATDLDYGELALNYTDEKLYFKNASNAIKSFNVTQSTLTIGTGLSGTSYNGTSAVTVAIDSTVATLTGTQTLTNKTISGSSNTLSNIPNSALTNSSVTINGTAVSLGGTATVTAAAGTLTGTTLNSTVVASSLTSVGTIATGTWAATDVALAHGGTNASLTAVNGGVVYSNASAMAITAAGTAGQALLSAGASAPVWTTLSLTDLPDAWTKKSVRVATTANITLSGTQTIDGIAVIAGDRVLVKDQSTASQNGIYVVAAGAWARSTDADTISELAGALVNVDSGTVNGGFRYDTDLKITDTLNTTAVNFYRVFDANDAATANTASKLVLRDASGNFSAGTITAALTGNASTATTLQTARTINGTSFNGSANITVTANTTNALTIGTGLSGTSFNGGSAVTIALATGYGDTQNPYASKTANNFLAAPNGASGVPTFRAIVAADIPTLNQNTTGSAATLTTGRTIALTGDVTYTSGSFNGSANVTGTATLANSGVTAGTYTKVTVDAKGRVTTGASILAADVPTLNQNTTGSAATLTTARTINTVSFNGSANIVVEPYVENDDSTNATRYITFVDSSTAGHQRLNEDSNFTINPSTGTVTTNGAFASTFALNKNTIDVSYSIPSGYNAVAAGPVVINNGITVTIPDGSTWVIV
jgi:hypothetical protein